MGLTGFLGRWALRRVHVLVVEVPGAAGVRMAVERELAARSWVPAVSPAEADVLAVCGSPGPRMSAVVEAVWDQLPGPRTRVDVEAAAGVSAAFEAAAAALLDTGAHRRDAASRSAPWADTDGGGDEHGDEHGDDDDMDMHMDMPMPGGIGLAGGGDDRDGLEMDVLHLPLGPVLPHWPPGLVLTCTLQGDVVVHASAEVLEPVPDRGLPVTGDVRRDVVVARCDAVARLLAVAGWDAVAAQARRVRDDALDGAALAECAAGLDRLTRRVTRSRVLRWSLRGLRTAVRAPGRAGADTHPVDLPDRLRGWLEEALAAARAPEQDAGTGPDAVPPAALPGLVTGLDLAAVRLVVAGTDVVADLTASTAGEAGRA
ncbi:hypothetical protein AB2L27_14120 [Kineococcus sp. LSe6-4]|uniref:Uncharacterized protein n=1 Tax=Kineococcus halophytocola TaxID=3234027 RepID=A0ABV4H678_9ACTN